MRPKPGLEGLFLYPPGVPHPWPWDGPELEAGPAGSDLRPPSPMSVDEIGLASDSDSTVPTEKVTKSYKQVATYVRIDKEQMELEGGADE